MSSGGLGRKIAATEGGVTAEAVAAADEGSGIVIGCGIDVGVVGAEVTRAAVAAVFIPTVGSDVRRGRWSSTWAA